MDHDDGDITFDEADFKDDRRAVWPDHHGEAVSKIPHAKRVSICMQDVFPTDSMLEGRWGNDRLIEHLTKITCDAIDGKH